MQRGDSTPAKPFHAIVTTTNYSENPKNKSCLTQSPFIWHPIPLNTDTLPAAVSSVPALSMVLNRGWFAHNRLSFWPYTGWLTPTLNWHQDIKSQKHWGECVFLNSRPLEQWAFAFRITGIIGKQIELCSTCGTAWHHLWRHCAGQSCQHTWRVDYYNMNPVLLLISSRLL